MFIEVYIQGELLNRWHIEDYEKCEVDCGSWEDNVRAREKLAEMYLQHFMKLMAPVVGAIGKAEYYLVFESKMRQITEVNETIIK